jgi:hypothetical protein
LDYSGHLRDALKELKHNVAEQFLRNGITLEWEAQGIAPPKTLGGLPVILHNLDEALTRLHDRPSKQLAHDIVEREVKRFLDERYSGRLKPRDLIRS